MRLPLKYCSDAPALHHCDETHSSQRQSELQMEVGGSVVRLIGGKELQVVPVLDPCRVEHKRGIVQSKARERLSGESHESDRVRVEANQCQWQLDAFKENWNSQSKYF